MLNRISFKNYKSFKDKQTLELKPITVLIGKNSSGKSAVAKLPTLIENSLSGTFAEPLQLKNNNGVELGGEFRDLVYGRVSAGLEIEIEDDTEKLTVSIASGLRTTDLPKIARWKFENKSGSVVERTDKDAFNGFLDTNTTIQSLSLNTDYIGPFRARPDRTYPRPSSTTIKKIGIEGEGAYTALIQDVLTTEQELIKNVSIWYETNFEAWGVRVVPNGTQYSIELTRNQDRLNINLRDVGQGMSQALPLIVRALMPVAKETLIIMEQPELHLHPAAHGNLAELFVNSLSEGNKRYLIETHSQNFVLRLRRLVAEKKLSPEQLNIYYVDFDEEAGHSKLIHIEVNNLGKVENWPKNIFSETLDETIAIRTAQLNEQRDAN